MAKKKVKPLQLEKAVNALLEEYGEQVFDGLEDSIKETADEAVEKLQAHRKFRKITSGEYAGSWTSEKQKVSRTKAKSIVYNEEHYRLTHLLENGHVIRNGTGRTFGKTEAFPHIAPVNDWAEKEVVEKVRAKLG